MRETDTERERERERRVGWKMEWSGGYLSIGKLIRKCIESKTDGQINI